MPLPPQHTDGPYRIALVCLGNICRSPMAHVVLEHAIAEVGLQDDVAVSSSGTGGWHVGDPMDERAAATLRAAGLDPSRHRAQRFDRSGTFDLVLAMDSANHAELRAQGCGDELMMFRDFDPAGAGDVPDPYYGGQAGFDRVLTMVERTAHALVEELARSRIRS